VRRRGINREGLAALLPVREGSEIGLQDALAELPTGRSSPFARIRSTHFARLLVVDDLPGPDGLPLGDMPTCLFFAAEFDMPVAGYLEALCALLPEQAGAIFGHCIGYPGADVPPAFAEWIRRHRVRAGFSVHGNPQATVREVVAALALRDQIIRFALETRRCAPAALQEAWKAEDWRLRHEAR
jgi:hypothetical protein